MPILETLAPIAANAAIGLALGSHNDKRQIKQQQKLTDMQLQADKNMSSFQKDMQMQMWRDTNYSAQKEEMIKAGLNPGLLYGMSGGGGVTTGAGAASSHGTSAQGNSNEIMGMIQTSAMQAQIDLIKAQTEKTKVETAKTAGVDTDTAVVGIENTKQQTENAILEGIIKKYTGMEAKAQYEEVKQPWRAEEARAHGDTQMATAVTGQAIQNLGVEALRSKTNAEIEKLLLNNAKTREETKNIIKGFDILEENLKGAQLNNILLEVETQWAKGTGLKSGNISSLFSKILGKLLGGK